MHTQHSQAEGMVAGEAAEAQQGIDDGDAGGFRQFHQFLPGVGGKDAVAGDQDRTFGLVDEAGRPLQGRRGFVGQRFSNGLRYFGILELGQFQLHVAGNINQHGTRATFLSNLESLANGVGQVGGGHYQVGALGADRGDGADVTFLEGFRTEGSAGNLAGDGHHRNGVGLGAHQAGLPGWWRRGRR